MNSEQVFACMSCYTTYASKEEAVSCAIDSCNMVESKFKCAECESLWDTFELSEWCCSPEDTLEVRAQFDGAIFDSDYEESPLEDDEDGIF